ncbi:DUF5979 domain-containing protein, partial [Georgenia alba]
LDGEAAGEVPGDAQFTVEYSTDGGQTWQPLTITADGTPVTVEDLPAGTEVQLRETDQRPDINGVEWGEVTLTVNGEPVDSPATFTIGSNTGVAVVVTNTAEYLPGSFSVAKAVDGAASGEVPGDSEFTVEYSTDGGETWEPLTVTADGTPVTSPDLPAGTEVLLRETDQRPDVPGVQWGEVTLTVDGEPVDGDTASFTIGADSTVELVVTNTASPSPGSFSVEKVLEGEAAGQVPEGTEFTIEYTVDGGEPQTATVTVGEPWTSPDLPAGSEVTVTEVNLPEIDGVTWGEPALTVDGEQAEMPATFTVGAGTTVAVVVTNTAEYTPGAFTVEKLLEGEAAGQVPEGTEFTIEYTVDGGEPQTATVTVGEPWTSPDLPAGSEVTVTEVNLPEIDGVTWGEPALTVDGEQAEMPATFTVDAGTTVGVEITNTAQPAPGGFEIVKELTGDAAGLVPPETEFTVEYSTDGGQT